MGPRLCSGWTYDKSEELRLLFLFHMLVDKNKLLLYNKPQIGRNYKIDKNKHKPKRSFYMSEKEKRLAGEFYNATDENLQKELYQAKDLCHEYNKILPSKLEERKQMMKKILGSTKENFIIEQPFMCDYGYNIEIGENFYANHNLVILDGNKVKFGDNVFIAPNCGFYTAGHPIDSEQRNKGLEYAKPIEVGNDVWIGGNVVVLPGTKIGNNCVIGAGSVVVKDIPENSIAVGNPCKVIRKIEQDIGKEE